MRWLLAAEGVVSLLIALALVGMWVRSYASCDLLWGPPDSLLDVEIQSEAGVLHCRTRGEVNEYMGRGGGWTWLPGYPDNLFVELDNANSIWDRSFDWSHLWTFEYGRTQGAKWLEPHPRTVSLADGWRGTVVYSGNPFLLRPNSWLEYRVALPYWPLVALFLILPVRRAWWWLRGRMRRANTCAACGYDLRGTPSGVGRECPECGEAIIAAEAS